MKLQRYIIGFLAMIAMASCSEVIPMDLPKSDPRLVIAGLISDRPGPDTIKIFLSGDFYAKTFEPVKGAVVKVSDDLGTSKTMQEVSDGIYVNDVEGQAGRTYSLEISYNNEIYTSQGFLKPSPKIDSLMIEKEEKTMFTEEGYYISFYAINKKVPGKTNYYSFKVYKNDSLYNGREDFMFTDDQYLGEKIDGFQLGYPFEEGDSVKLEMYTIDNQMFDYMDGLLEVLWSDGGMFSSPHVNPTTNITNVTNPDHFALGYFQVSGVSSGKLLIKAEDVGKGIKDY